MNRLYDHKSYLKTFSAQREWTDCMLLTILMKLLLSRSAKLQIDMPYVDETLGSALCHSKDVQGTSLSSGQDLGVSQKKSNQEQHINLSTYTINVSVLTHTYAYLGILRFFFPSATSCNHAKLVPITSPQNKNMSSVAAGVGDTCNWFTTSSNEDVCLANETCKIAWNL